MKPERFHHRGDQRRFRWESIIISADLMDRDGQEVLFARHRAVQPAGGRNRLQPWPPAEFPLAADPAATDAVIRPDIASLSQMREDSFEALSMLKEMVSAPEKPDAGAVSAAYDDAVAKLKDAATAGLPEGSSPEAMAMAQSMRAQAEAALTAIMPTASIDA